jgi:hypothetical protein
MDENIAEITHDGSKVTADLMLNLLNQKYRPGGWAFFCEVPDATGSLARRRIDAVAVSLWSKPGIGHTIAFETKISRSDFKNEIADPTKRKAAIENSNEFYFVCLKGIITPQEVPEDCGLMEVVGDKEKGTLSLRVAKIAQQRASMVYTRGFFASMMRQADGRTLNLDNHPFMRLAGKNHTLEEFEKLVASEVEKRVGEAVAIKTHQVEMQLKFNHEEASKKLVNRLVKIFDIGYQYDQERYIQAIEKEALKRANGGVPQEKIVEIIKRVVGSLYTCSPSPAVHNILMAADSGLEKELYKLKNTPPTVQPAAPTTENDEDC